MSNLEGFDYSYVIISAMATRITSVPIVYSTVCSGAGQRKHLRYASLAFEGGIHRWPVNSPDKGPVTRTMFPFDDVTMTDMEGDHIGETWRMQHIYITVRVRNIYHFLTNRSRFTIYWWYCVQQYFGLDTYESWRTNKTIHHTNII